MKKNKNSTDAVGMVEIGNMPVHNLGDEGSTPSPDPSPTKGKENYNIGVCTNCLEDEVEFILDRFGMCMDCWDGAPRAGS